MQGITFDTTIKEIIKNPRLKQVCNSVSGNLFENPALVQAESMSLQRIAALLGANGTQIMSSVIERANKILADMPDGDTVGADYDEVRRSVGREAAVSEEERLGHIKHNCSIRPGKVWYDTEGNRIQAHGACVFYENGRYYWIGENKDHTTKDGEIWTWGVKIYSSDDLYNWTDEGYLIEPELEDTSSIFWPVRRLDRPHLVYNARTKKYVLWLKFCDDASYAVLTSDSLMGRYELVRRDYHPFGTHCGDFDLAVDDDTGNAYLYWEVNHTDVWGVKLSSDYTAAEGAYSVIYSNLKPPYAREAVTHMQRGGKHYIFTSGMTGYVPNPSEVAVSDEWLTGYKILGDPHVDDESKSSFNSQLSCIFKVHGKSRYIAVADRWVPEFVMTAQKYDIIVRVITSRENKNIVVTDEEKKMFASMPMMGSADTSVAGYVWLPIEFEGDIPRIVWREEWNV